jgi:hypothetical protein
LGETVFDVIESGVNENTGIIPSAGLDAYGLMNETMLGEVLVGDGDGYGEVLVNSVDPK